MGVNIVRPPFVNFTDIDGTPLESGYVYIGEAGFDAQSQPKTVYADSDLTSAIAQPIRTIAGAPVLLGTPITVYVAGDYSITVRNKRGELVHSSLEVDQNAQFETTIVDVFGDLAGVSDDIVDVGDQVFVLSNGRAYVRAPDASTDFDLNYIGSGGCKWYEVGPEYSSRAAAARAVARGDRSNGETVTGGTDAFLVNSYGVDGLLCTSMNFGGALDDLASDCASGKTVKIAVYGDSSVDGNGTGSWTANPTDGSGNAIGAGSHNPNAPFSWPVVLQTNLRNMFKNNAISVYNAGYGGKEIITNWAQNNYNAAIINNPAYGTQNYVLIGFGLNDIARLAWNVDTYTTMYWALCDQIYRSGAVPIVCTPDVAAENTARQGSSLSIVCDVQKDIAGRFNIPVIDMNAMQVEYFGAANGNLRFLFAQPDDLHFGNRGHELKAGYAAARMFPNTLFLEGDNVAVPPWSKYCNTSHLTYSLFDDGNNKFGGSMNVTQGTYTTGQTLIDLYVWSTREVFQLFWRSMDGDGYYNPRTMANAPRIVVSNIGLASDQSIQSLSAGQLVGVTGRRGAEVPTPVMRILPSGMSRIRFNAPTDNADNAVYLGYFEFRNMGVKEASTTLPLSGTGHFVQYVDQYDAANELVGYGPEKGLTMMLEATIPNGVGVMLWGGRAFNSDGVNNLQRAVMLYRNDTAGTASLYNLTFDNTGTVTLGTLIGGAAYTFTASDKFRITASISATGNVTLSVYVGWATDTALFAATINVGSEQPIMGGRVLPGFFKNYTLTGAQQAVAKVIIQN